MIDDTDEKPQCEYCEGTGRVTICEGDREWREDCDCKAGREMHLQREDDAASAAGLM